MIYIIEATFLAYTIVIGTYSARTWSGFEVQYGPEGWIIGLFVIYCTPFVVIFFMNVPFAQTLEIMTAGKVACSFDYFLFVFYSSFTNTDCSYSCFSCHRARSGGRLGGKDNTHIYYIPTRPTNHFFCFL